MSRIACINHSPVFITYYIAHCLNSMGGLHGLYNNTANGELLFFPYRQKLQHRPVFRGDDREIRPDDIVQNIGPERIQKPARTDQVYGLLSLPRHIVRQKLYVLYMIKMCMAYYNFVYL